MKSSGLRVSLMCEHLSSIAASAKKKKRKTSNLESNFTRFLFCHMCARGTHVYAPVPTCASVRKAYESRGQRLMSLTLSFSILCIKQALSIELKTCWWPVRSCDPVSIPMWREHYKRAAEPFCCRIGAGVLNSSGLSYQ